MTDLEASFVVVRAMARQERAERAERAERRARAAKRSIVRAGQTWKHVRSFPRVIVSCPSCGRTHTFAHVGTKGIGFGCGTEIPL